METKTQSTVISIAPVDITFNANGAFYPGYYKVPKSDGLKPSSLVISDGWTRIFLGSDVGSGVDILSGQGMQAVARGYRRIPILSFDIARSVVEDFLRSVICTDGAAHPGVFWEPKVILPESIEKECNEKLSQARVSQLAWEEVLIRMADEDWIRSDKRPRSVSDLQRQVAKKRGYEKEWLYVPKVEEGASIIICPACRTQISSLAVVCANCNLILKPEEYKKLQFVG